MQDTPGTKGKDVGLEVRGCPIETPLEWTGKSLALIKENLHFKFIVSSNKIRRGMVRIRKVEWDSGVVQQ